jgi:hypothetical protein
MIHVSLYLFFAGLLIYLVISFMAMIKPDSPYYTPITSITRSWKDMQKMAEESVQRSSAEVDNFILNWLLKTSFKDSDLLRLFECIPDFYHSSLIDDRLPYLTSLDWGELLLALRKFLVYTWSPNISSYSDKMRRLVCVRVVDAVRLRDVALFNP